MRISRDVKCGDLTITVYELQVCEVRAWLAEPPSDPDRPVDWFTDLLSFDGITVEDLFRFTNLTRDQLGDLTPSDLAKLASVVKAVNSVFFDQYLPTVAKLREQMPSATSNAPSVP